MKVMGSNGKMCIEPVFPSTLSYSQCNFMSINQQKIIWLDISSYIVLFLKKWANQASFLFIFGLFQTNINTILQPINVKKCRSSIWHRDSNPQPSEHESPHITTRPGLPPLLYSSLGVAVTHFSIWTKTRRFSIKMC